MELPSNLLILVFTIAIAISFLSTPAAGDECKDFVGGLTKRQIGGIQECNKKLGLKTSKEKKEKMSCVLKCIAIKEKLLGPSGLFEDETLDGFLRDELPKSLFEKGSVMFKKCRDDYGSTLKPDEESCASYGGVFKCLLGILGDICK